MNRQLDNKVGTESPTMYVHLTYVPNTNSNEKPLNNNNEKKNRKVCKILLNSVALRHSNLLLLTGYTTDDWLVSGNWQ